MNAVIATAGHVDHGKSSLIERLTGIDPDRLSEEKRRGLTIDLGYAWCALPSGREIGFVDVPGHERFIRNMLAGVGPVRLVLFVVAADEGWKEQSEEHLQILDVLGVDGAVIALTKSDAAGPERIAETTEQVRSNVEGTALQGAPIVPVSSVTGAGLDDIKEALDVMVTVAAADSPTESRARLFIDRVFTSKGAGTVITGTLTGGRLTTGDDVELYPSKARARIRGMQSHKTPITRAEPVSRVAVNLAGIDRDQVERGQVLSHPGSWRVTREFEAEIRPVRGLKHPLVERGSFKVYAGTAEADAKLRFIGQEGEDGIRLARVRLSRPMALDVFERFVLRESGRSETVAGGRVLDPAPPKRPGPDAHLRLSARSVATREDLPRCLLDERGAVRVSEARMLTGTTMVQGGDDTASWLVRDDIRGAVERAVSEALLVRSAKHPLQPGIDSAGMRDVIASALRSSGAPLDSQLIQQLLDGLTGAGVAMKHDSLFVLPGTDADMTHGVASPEFDRLTAAISGAAETAPPRLSELGIDRQVIEAATRAGVVVRIAPDLILSPGLVDRALATVADATGGTTVSALREALGISRKYAVPLMEWMDSKGLTRREGDLRFATGKRRTEV